ncbi:MAG: mechanosensitive ion channel [Candidatus Thorarchaeota archaeon]|nr:mechanosensitive ion channel [Candidatus Thorarchaeota archaeon]
MIQVPPDFLIDPIGYIQFYIPMVGPYIFLAIQLLLLLIIYWVVVRIFRRSLYAVGMGTEATGSITLILRLVFFIISITLLIDSLNPDITALLSITTIFGMALGLAFSQALSNIVSGLYVLVARPFQIGDYVRIGNTEGIVREITLNYTRILMPDQTRQLLPNSKIVTSEVTNFRINLFDYIKEREEESEDKLLDRDYRRYLRKGIKQLKKMAADGEAFRYTFDLTYHMRFDHGELRKTFKRVCDEWESEFVTKPTYNVWAAPGAGLTYRFAIIVKEPMTIIKRLSDFIDNLTTIYDIPDADP